MNHSTTKSNLQLVAYSLGNYSFHVHVTLKIFLSIYKNKIDKELIHSRDDI